MKRDADIVVVGAGIAGVATARAIARAGRLVLLLEQFALGHARGSSHGATRIFRLSYPDERFVRLAQASLEGWRELEAEAGTELVSPVGALDLGALAFDNARALSACGVPFESLTGAEVGRRWAVSCGPDEPALFQKDGGVIRADLAYRLLVETGRADGVEILERTRVTGLRVERGTVRLATTGAELVANAVVVTAGAWVDPLLEPLGLGAAVVPTRETVAYVEHADAASLPTVIDYERLPAPGTAGLVRAGQAAYALATPGLGLKVGLHHAGPVTDPGTDPPPEQAVVDWAGAWARERFPGAGAVVGAETCIYTSTADESFVLERHGRVVVGSACSGHGFKFAPQVGRTLAALAVEAAG